jgi:hypothetical protein
MPSGTYGTTVSAAGVNIAKSAVITADSASGIEVTLPIAHAVGSWVKTDADTAAGTLTAGHGQTTGTYDVYWTGGERLGVAVTVTVNAIALEGGAGTDFPATANATVVICPQTNINAAIDGDELEMFACSLEYTDTTATSVGNLDFQSSAPATVETIDLVANTPQVWTGTAAQAKFTGDPITDVIASHSNTAAAATLKLVIMQDSTP